MTSIANLRNNKKNRLENLQKQASEQNTKKTYKDDRYWKLTIDRSTGIGSAVIRFLFSKEEKDKIVIFEHGFQDPITNKWLLSICPTSYYGEKEYSHCPVCQANGKLWEEGQKDQFSRQKRKQSFISNIYVVKDPGNPENEGKVFLFKYGKAINKKIKAMLIDEFDEGNVVDVFDFDTGRDFHLRSKKNSGGWIEYDDSKFRDTNNFSGKSDEELEALFKLSHSLDEIISLEVMPAYDDLKKNYERVTSKVAKKSQETDEAPVENEEEFPAEKERKTKSVHIDDGLDMDEMNAMMDDILNTIDE
jgi:hypothetical protein